MESLNAFFSPVFLFKNKSPFTSTLKNISFAHFVWGRKHIQHDVRPQGHMQCVLVNTRVVNRRFNSKVCL